MLRTVSLRLVISFIVLGAVALPAVSTAQVAWQDICEQWIENHPHDPAWAQRCVEWMYFWELSHPERYLRVPDPPKRRVFPYDRTWIPPGSHDGDKASIAQTLLSGETADVIVEIDAADLREDIHTRALEEGLYSLSPDMLAEKAAGFAVLKTQALAGIPGIVPLEDYANLPVIYVRLLNKAALDELVDRLEVRAVHENQAYELFLSQSLPLIEHPAAVAEEQQGAGTTVAVLDTGVDYTRAPFNCTAPGIPSGCRVLDTREAGTDDGNPLDDDGHGTNVSGIVASTAGEANLIVADVFSVTPDGQRAFGVPPFPWTPS